MKNTIPIQIHYLEKEYGTTKEKFACANFYHVPRIGEKIQLFDSHKNVKVTDVVSKIKINRDDELVQEIEVHGVIYPRVL